MPSPYYFLKHFVPFTGYPYTGAPAACNLCGCWEAVTIAETDRRLKTIRSIACTQCGLIRTDPMPGNCSGRFGRHADAGVGTMSDFSVDVGLEM